MRVHTGALQERQVFSSPASNLQDPLTGKTVCVNKRTQLRHPKGVHLL